MKEKSKDWGWMWESFNQLEIQASNGVLDSAFIQEFRNWESAWALEALYVIAYEIRVLAERVKNR